MQLQWHMWAGIMPACSQDPMFLHTLSLSSEMTFPVKQGFQDHPLVLSSLSLHTRCLGSSF